MRIAPVSLLALSLIACSNNAAGPDGGGGAPATAVESVPLMTTVESAGLAAPVDVVRDEWGIPHVYGSSLSDVAFAQGYAQAQDRLIQMDLLRRNAEGTLSELVGGLSDSIVNSDIGMRVHHLRATSQAAFDQLRASTDPNDQMIVTSLGRFADGVNAYVDDLKAGNYSIPPALIFLYDPKGFRPWNEVDSVLLVNFETFYFNYSASAEIALTQLETQATAVFDNAKDILHSARKGIYKDLTIFAPIDPTYTISGWTGMNGDTSQASIGTPLIDTDGNLLALLAADRAPMKGIGRDWLDPSTAASNNWVIGGKLTANGHVLVANDTHVPLQNPPIWHMVHLVGRGGDKPFNAMGESIPGVPAIVLGMNEHVAWGATTDQMDQTDVYQESIVNCDGGANPCVMFKGQKVPLVPRKESFGVGKYGKIDHTVEVTFYDVPHHGPILPRVTPQHALEPLGQTELSVRYVGYEPTQLVRAATGILFSKTMKEWAAALDRDNKVAAFNWVVGDDQGNFGWTEIARVPRRAKDIAPWKVMPGDGSAEWGPDMDPRYIPHAWNPDKGFLATANADPIGVTDDGDPFFNEPVVDGAPLYLTWDYVDGARVGRITKRIQSAVNAGKKLTLDDMQSIQADTVSEWSQLLAPTLIDAGSALVEEMQKPGTHSDLTALLDATDSPVKQALSTSLDLMKGWTSFDTPSGVAEDNPTPQQIADSQATLIFHDWLNQMIHLTFDDEVAELNMGVSGEFLVKLLVRASLHPNDVASGISKDTGDPTVFDDMGTQPIESKRQIAAQAVLNAIADLQMRLGNDMTRWRWGTLHTLTLDFLVPMAALKIPLKTDPQYPNGFPRHGAPETVDPGGGALDDFTYSHGPGIRFVCELDPAKGPIARNVLPGGEAFDPGSPHYRDQMELWRKNKTFDLAFHDEDVVKSANAEWAKNMIGRIRFQPKK